MASSWANSGLDLHLDLGPEGTRRGRRDALERALRDAISDGRLGPGTTLPPSRSLSADLGIARNTVAEAYAQLVAEGWLTARQGAATRVAERAVPDPLASPADADRARRPRFDLRAGHPDVAGFPRSEWLAAARAAVSRTGAATFDYGPSAGEAVLRTALATYLARTRGVRVAPAGLVVTAGFSAGLGPLATVLVAQGARTIGVECYSHRSHRALLAASGLNIVPLPVDEDGAVPEGLEQLDAVLLTPAHQFPRGGALSTTRRGEFTRWAARTGAVIIEDDYDGEFRYDRRALGAMQALLPQEVVYAGTASKALAPAVQLGWLALPPRLLAAVVERQALTHNRPSTLNQLTLAEFLDSGRYDRHIRRSRLRYRRRRDLLVDGLARRTPRVQASGINAGMHTVLTLPAGSDESGLVERAHERGLAIEGLSSYLADEAAPSADAPPALVIGYATPPQHAYTAALARLFSTIRQDFAL